MTVFIISFLILITIVLWYVIGTKGNYIVKVIAIGFSLWYGIALYYGIPTLMGWPSLNNIPDGSLVIAYTIKKPTMGDKGNIYLWIRHIQKEEKKSDIIEILDPTKALNYTFDTCPRAYEIPYDENTAKKLSDKKNKSKLKFIKRDKKGKKGTNRVDREDKEKVDVILKDLSEIFEKE